MRERKARNRDEKAGRMMTLLFRVLAFAASATLLGASQPHSDAAYFLGTWKCAGVTWAFMPLAPESPWIRDVYGDPAHPDGTAVLGYVDGLHAWVYRDFHADGSYADLTSNGPKDGRWEWMGPYYPASGGPTLNARISYIVVDPSRFDRVFESLKDGAFVKLGGDTCTKTSDAASPKP